MVKLFAENIELPLAAFWYHYRSISRCSKTFKLIVSMDETDVIKEIEKYAGCLIDDNLLSKKIKKKDEENRSIGLIWLLQILFEKMGYSDVRSIESIDWTINNIRQILVKDNQVEILGDINDS